VAARAALIAAVAAFDSPPVRHRALNAHTPIIALNIFSSQFFFFFFFFFFLAFFLLLDSRRPIGELVGSRYVYFVFC
jgi:hypothetical protein